MSFVTAYASPVTHVEILSRDWRMSTSRTLRGAGPRTRHLCEFLLHQERFLPHYHRRSNVETVFARINVQNAAGCRP